jgi:ABC-type transporter Mla subunit MlaD
MPDSEMRKTAQALEMQLEKLYITATAIAFSLIILITSVIIIRLGWTAFGIILASGFALIVLIITAAILTIKKKSYKEQCLQQLHIMLPPRTELEISKDIEQNQPVTDILEDPLHQSNPPSSQTPRPADVTSENSEQIQCIKQNFNSPVTSNTQSSASISNNSEQFQQLTHTFIDFLSQNSQEYQLSLALFKDIKAIRRSLSANADK